MTKFLLSLVLLALTPFSAMAKEIVTLNVGMAMRECAVNSFGNNVCLGKFDEARPVEIALTEDDSFQSGYWEEDYKIGSEVFKANVTVVKSVAKNIYGVTLSIEGQNFNPKAAIAVKGLENLSNLRGFQVMDDSLFIKDISGKEYSPALYLH